MTNWDQRRLWDQQPTRPATYLIIALLVVLAWLAIAAAKDSPTDNGRPLSLTAHASPIEYGTKLGTTGSGDGNIV